ncbi:MAG: DUF1822 family protein [Candidatus Avigastranaerophilus sp.]
MTNNIELEIDDKARSYAKIYASLIENDFQRKRAYASITALYAFANLMEKIDYPVQKAMTIFRNPELNEKYEISDIYINDWHIDVRVMIEGNSFIIPRIHEEYSIEPDFYAVIKIDSSLKSAELLGFANPKSIKKEPLDYHYYSVSTQELINCDEFFDVIKNKKELNINADEHRFFLTNYLSLIDNEIDEDSLKRILKHLFLCPKCRAEFCCFTGFEMVNCKLGKYPQLLEDQTLDIIGAQAADSKEYEGKEETVYFDDKENEENTPEEQEKQSDKQEEEIIEIPDEDTEFINDEDNSTVSDILDELFNIEDEETVDTTSDETNSEDLTLLPDEFEQKDDENSSEIVEIEEFHDDLEVLSEEDEDNEMLEIDTDSDIMSLDEPEGISLLDSDDLDSEVIENIENTDKEQKENVDKVIVDYDENGEPIYSYITNVPQEEYEQSEIEGIEDIEEIEDIEATAPEINIIDDTIITEEEPANIGNDIDIIENETEEELEYPQENKTFNETVEPFREEITEDDEESEYEDIKDEECINTPAEEHSEEETENIGEETYQDDIDEKYENDAVSEDDDDENDDDEEYDEEYDYNEGNNSDIQKGSSKKGMLVASILAVAVIAASAVTYGYIKKATDETKTAVNTQEAQIPHSEVTAELFEGINDNDVFAKLGGENSPSDDLIVPDNNEIPSTQTEETAPSEPEQAQTPAAETPGADESNVVKPLTEKDLLEQKPTNDVNKAMANAFSDQTKLVSSIKGLNWMCAPGLFTNTEFKNYLQNVDKTLRMNLNSNILNSSTVPVNNSITYKIAIDNEGNLLKTQAVGSTGSDEIDNIVLQSIKETLAMQKTQILSSGQQKADKYYIQVVINF